MGEEGSLYCCVCRAKLLYLKNGDETVKKYDMHTQSLVDLTYFSPLWPIPLCFRVFILAVLFKLSELLDNK